MEDMSAVAATIFDKNYELHQKHLKLKGLQPKTIDTYSRAIRRVGDYFDHQISLGLRLGEGLRLTVADIDGARERVHIRDAKGNKDRLVPLPTATYRLLRRFWLRHRNPVLLFPNRRGGLPGAHTARTPLDRSGVQNALRAVVASCGLKKTFHHTACAMPMPRT